jgi:hypothetical protein
MNRLGIELLSVFGMPPVEFLNLAADLGCQYISTAMTGFPLPSSASDNSLSKTIRRCVERSSLRWTAPGFPSHSATAC